MRNEEKDRKTNKVKKRKKERYITKNWNVYSNMYWKQNWSLFAAMVNFMTAWEAWGQERPRACSQAQDRRGGCSSSCSGIWWVCFSWTSWEKGSKGARWGSSWKEAPPSLWLKHKQPIMSIFLLLVLYIYICFWLIYICVSLS